MKEHFEWMLKKLDELEKEVIPKLDYNDEKQRHLHYKFHGIAHHLSMLKGELDTRMTPYEVPEGYKWCEECQALTPHYQHESHSWQKNCVICDNSHYGSEGSCPNCGWNEPEDQGPLEQEIALHGDGCHYKPYHDMDDFTDCLQFDNLGDDVLYDFMNQFRTGMISCKKEYFEIKKTLQRLNLWTCSCPRVKVYPYTYIYNFHSGSVWSDACSNAMEWSYDIRCPQCGEIYHVSDGNC